MCLPSSSLLAQLPGWEDLEKLGEGGVGASPDCSLRSSPRALQARAPLVPERALTTRGSRPK